MAHDTLLVVLKHELDEIDAFEFVEGLPTLSNDLSESLNNRLLRSSKSR